MNIVILDASTVTGDDLSWDCLKDFGDLIAYERTYPHEIIERSKDAKLLITSKCILDKKIFDECPNIRYVGIIATGYNNIDLEYARHKGIAVTNIPAYSTNSVAQHVFALLFELTNKVSLHNEAVQNGDWYRSEDFCFCLSHISELAGKTFGIFGYGNIGKTVAKIANSFGMKVLLCTGHEDKTDKPSYIEYVDCERLYSESDFISLHCALTDHNQEFINEDTIAAMKDGVILINTARGPLINESDLADALRKGKVAAAGLDVLSKEPPTEGNPLIGIRNCIITPHIAWSTREARQRLIDTEYDNINAFLSGEKLNRID